MQKSRSRGSGGVRIIGGTWRGRRIRIARGTSVRPTPDRVRETLFNWLAGRLPGARCLDVFAGSGVLGLEALSRGADEAWLVEHDPALVRALEQQVETLGANARVIQGDALEILSDPSGESFDIVFADPPYDMALTSVLRELALWVSPNHVVYVERRAQPGGDPLADLVEVLAGAQVVKQGRAGDVAFGLVRLGNDAGAPS